MKKLKKLMAFVITAAMCMAMAVPAMADDPAPAESGASQQEATIPESGSITVTTNFDKQTYTLYKLFDAHITFNADGTQRAITYTLPDGKSLDGNAYYEVNDNGFIEAKDTLTDAVLKSAAYITWAKGFGTQVGDPIKANGDNDANVSWTELDWGYYFVDSTLGSFITVDSNNPDVNVIDKNQKPTIDKEIVSIAGARDTLGVGDDATDPGNGVREKGIAQIGETVNFQLTIKARPGAESYVVQDELPAGLTPPAASAVTVDAGSSNVETTVHDHTIVVVFKPVYLNTITQDTTITITYAATVNSNAVIGADGNTNTATLQWGDGSAANQSTDSAVIYTGQIEATKKDDKGVALANAGFVLKKGEQYYKLYNGTVSWVTKAEADEHFSDASGAVAPFTGLKNGTYTLEEKTVPAGYNKLTDQTIPINATTYDNDNLKKSVTVTNKAGAVLPSTGGMGTTIFYVVGAILVIGAGVLLVVRRRMREE